MGDVYVINGEYQIGDIAHIPVTDLSLVRGYGVFDFTRTYHKRAWYLREHVARLFRSAESIDLEMIWSPQEIMDMVNEGIRRSSHPDCYVRIMVTAGDGLDSLTPGGQPRLIITVTAAKPYPTELYAEGIKVITVDEPRYLPGVKSLSYIAAILAMKKARQSNALEAIYLDKAGYVQEGTTTNLFAFIEGHLVTPPLEDVLSGITRGIVIELAEGLFDVQQAPIHIDELYRADEVFVTSSTKQIMPVTRVDDLLIREGKPGAGTQKLIACFDALVNEGLT